MRLEASSLEAQLRNDWLVLRLPSFGYSGLSVASTALTAKIAQA